MYRIFKVSYVSIPQSEAFQRWTSREGVNTFFGEDAHIQLCKNGAYEIFFSMSAPEGYRGSEGCHIIDFHRPTFIEFTWNVPPSFPELREIGYQSLVRVSFYEIDKHLTKVILDNTFPSAPQELEGVRRYFERAWDHVMKAFTEACQR